MRSSQLWPTTKLLRTKCSPPPLSLPSKSRTDRLQSLQHSYKRGGKVKALTDTLWNSVFLPQSWAWPSLLSSNPTAHKARVKSLVVESGRCHTAHYCLIQKAENAKTRHTSTQHSWAGFFFFLLLPTPNFWCFLLLLVALSKGHAQIKRLWVAKAVTKIFRQNEMEI